MKRSILLSLLLFLTLSSFSQGKEKKPYLRIPVIDLDKETFRQVIVDKEDGQYLGHPTTVLLEDGKTILAVYPKGHGQGTIVFKKSTDGGLTWSKPTAILSRRDMNLSEPGLIRSPNGKMIAVLLRENSRRKNSQIIFSRDEGKSWTSPRALPNELTGDRHVLKYTPDGRLLVVFRDISPLDTRPDLVKAKKGEYRIRFKDNLVGWDCCYPGVELLPDGTFVVTTYGHWGKDKEPYIISIRITMDELDEKFSNLINK
jgi:hypothetical protein